MFIQYLPLEKKKKKKEDYYCFSQNEGERLHFTFFKKLWLEVLGLWHNETTDWINRENLLSSWAPS